MVPPNFLSYRRYCPYTAGGVSPVGGWRGPDLVRAPRLVARSHTKGVRVTIRFRTTSSRKGAWSSARCSGLVSVSTWYGQPRYAAVTPPHSRAGGSGQSPFNQTR